MKKSFALILSVAMVLSMMAGFLTFTVTSSAAQAGVQSVKVSLDGVADNEITLDATTTSAASGAITFDATTGTVTLNNATFAYLYSPSDDAGMLTVVLTGTNTANGAHSSLLYTVRGWRGLTIQGTGSLNCTNGNSYTIGTITGDLTIKGSVTITVNASGSDAIHQGNGKRPGTDKADGKMLICENAVVTVTAHSGNAIRSQQETVGGITIKDNAKVSATNTALGNWSCCINSPGDYIQEGNAEVTLTGTAPNQCAVGLASQPSKASGYSGKLKLAGGKLTITMTSTYTSDNCRAYCFLAKNSTAIIDGTECVFNLTCAKAADPSGISQGVFQTQNDGGNSGFEMHSGSMTVNAATSSTLFCPNVGNQSYTIDGGTITGTAKALWAPVSDNCVLNVKPGALIDFTATQKLTSTRTGATINVTAPVDTKTDTVLKTKAPATDAVVVTPVSGDAVTLNGTTTSMSNGAITFDAAAKKLTLNNATGIKSIEKSFEGDLTIEVKGTNSIVNKDLTLITDLKNADSAPGAIHAEDGLLKFVGDGTLKIEANGQNIVNDAGSITFGDKVKIELTADGAKKYAAPILTGYNSKTSVITFQDEANVKISAVAGACIQMASWHFAYGDINIKDKANVDLKVTDAEGWMYSAIATNWNISGGKVKVDIAGKEGEAAIVGLEAAADNTARGDRNSSFKMTGGTVDIKVVSNATSGRAHGIFCLYGKETSFSGGTVNLDVTTTGSIGDSGTICNQWNNAADKLAADDNIVVTVSGKAYINVKASKTSGLFTFNNGNGNTHGIVNIKGGTIVGSGNAFVNACAGKGGTLNITGGAIDWTSSAKNVIGFTTKDVTVTFKEGGVASADKVIKVGTPGNPPTSDLTFAVVSAIALLSVLAAAAVVIRRKKVNG